MWFEADALIVSGQIYGVIYNKIFLLAKAGGMDNPKISSIPIITIIHRM